MKRIKKYVLCCLLTINLLNAKIIEIDNGGSTFPIVEKDLIKLFKNHIINNKDKINKKLSNEQKKLKKKFENYKPKDLTIKLTKTTKNRTFFPDTTYTLEKDIKNNFGTILYKKGFKYNPLKFLKLPHKYIIIDITDKKQKEWLRKQDYKNIAYQVLLYNGSFIEFRKEFGIHAFYLKNQIIEKFHLKNIPAIVSQEGEKLRVQEFTMIYKKGNKK